MGSVFSLGSFTKAGDRIPYVELDVEVGRVLSGAVLLFIALASNSSTRRGQGWRTGASYTPTATPIKYLVVVFDVSISFDHYFATYPKAYNTIRFQKMALPSLPRLFVSKVRGTQKDR